MTEPNAALVELRKQIEYIIFDKKHHGSYSQAMRQTANEIIEACNAARDAEIRELLLSDGAIDGLLQRTMGWDDYDKGTTYEDKPEEEKVEWRDEGRHYIEGALDHIGLHGDGTGGQG